MVIIKLLRFITGYVCFKAQGGFPERFINLCSLRRISLWDLKESGGVITACTDAGSYRRIRTAAEKSGMRLKITEKHGLPFIMKRRRDRCGLIIGAAVFAAIFVMLSGRVWTVTTLGNTRVTSEKILSVMSDLGVKPGVRTKSVSASDLQNEAMKRLPELSWMYVNISGCRAVIEVREVQYRPERENGGLFNLVASRSGRLTALRVFNGTPQLSPGSAVIEGDVLISGIEENRDGSPDISGADGYAEAITERRAAGSAALRERLSFHRVIQRSPSLGILTLEMKMPRLGRRAGAAFRNESFLELNGVKLPFFVSLTVLSGSESRSVKLSRGQARLLALCRFFENACDELDSVEIKDSSVELTDTGGGTVIEGSYTCLENIGIKKEMSINTQD